MFYEILQDRLMELLQGNGLIDTEVTVETRALKPHEAIGNPDRDDFPLLKGREVLMQATFLNHKGQAFTDAPSAFRGTLRKIIEERDSGPRERARFIATLNAVVRHFYPDVPTIHCRDQGPALCSREIARFVGSLNMKTVGLLGLQPAILHALVSEFGTENVMCIDRDEDNRDIMKCGVPIRWGDRDGLDALFVFGDVILATGSSVANGTIVDILDMNKTYAKPLYFYGTTIAGSAHLMGLNHLCYQAS